MAWPIPSRRAAAERVMVPDSTSSGTAPHDSSNPGFAVTGGVLGVNVPVLPNLKRLNRVRDATDPT